MRQIKDHGNGSYTLFESQGDLQVHDFENIDYQTYTKVKDNPTHDHIVNGKALSKAKVDKPKGEAIPVTVTKNVITP